MPIRAELRADKERGPGHALLRIGGLSGFATLDFAFERSQGTTPYLGPGGVWQATEVWHTARDPKRDGDAAVISLGPDLVDAIVQQGAATTFRLSVATETNKERTTLAVHRPLLGSRAAAPHEPAPSAQTAPVVEVPAPEPAETTAGDQPAAVPLDPWLRPPPDRARGGLWIALSLAGLALAVLGAIAWQQCWFHDCGAPAAAPEVAAPAGPAPGSAAAPVGSGRSCTGLDGARCLDVARAALAAGDLEAGRQLLQQASQLGSVAANIAIGRMYDPQTWKAETSPVPQPDWETAVYWYEAAARQDDPAGQLAAGRLLCMFATGDFERQRGLVYLRTAASAGDDEAKTLLAQCEKKVAQ